MPRSQTSPMDQRTQSAADHLWQPDAMIELCEQGGIMADGSYLSRIYPSETDRRHQTHSIRVRVIENRLEGVPDAEPIYRLVTSVLDPQHAPANENHRSETPCPQRSMRQVSTTPVRRSTHRALPRLLPPA